MTEEEKRETVNAVMAEIDKRTQRVQDLPESFDLADFNTLPVLNRDGRMSTLNAGQLKGESGVYKTVDHGTSDTTLELTPNVLHRWGEVAALSLTLGAGVEGQVCEYMIEFRTPTDTATTLTLPDTVKWADDYTPVIAPGRLYQVSILNNLAIMAGYAK